MLSFDEVLKNLTTKKRTSSLLMGNGFSMSYDKDIFSYNALFNFIASKDDALINKLFGAIKTKNFELVMQQLDTTISLLNAFDADDDLKKQIANAAEHLKKGLLDSIQQLHPEHVFKMAEEKSAICAKFLSFFLATGGHIFSTNYDLLLYWVLMRQAVPDAIDGFGRELLNAQELALGKQEAEWSGLVWGPNTDKQNVHYLHGALHIFDSGKDILKEQYDSAGYILENIKTRLNDGIYPVFVTAGNGDEKLNHIMHNRYLTHCYEELSKVDGSVVTFGFNFGPYDEHIIEALNKAAHAQSKMPPKLWSIYIGVYSQADADHIESIRHKFHCKVQIFDAKTANVWCEN